MLVSIRRLYNMKAAAVRALALVTVALATGEDFGISVYNNGTTYSPKIIVKYFLNDGTERKYKTPIISSGKTETVGFPQGFKDDIRFTLNFTENSSLKQVELMEICTNSPLKMCFQIWGSDNDPQIGQLDCKSKAAPAHVLSDGGAISMTNNATYPSGIYLGYVFHDKIVHQKVPVNPGETVTNAIPKGAKHIAFVYDEPTIRPDYFRAYFFQPVTLCFKVWGSAKVFQSAQIDC